MVNLLTKLSIVCIILNLFITSIIQTEATAKEPDTQQITTTLTLQEKKTLLEIARKTLISAVKYNTGPEIDDEELKKFERLQKRSGTFVTLKSKDQLRGCIGNIFPNQEVYKAIARNTISSAFYDRRFMPVTEHELNNIEIEISVLSDIMPIKGHDEYDVTKHGIIIRKGDASAVFLPQVATEQQWDKEETLNHLCRKAGLPQNGWKENGMQFSVFTAEVFRETDFHDKGQPKQDK